MSKIYYFLGHEQFQPEVLVKHAILAEEAGFDGVAVSEHFNPWVADLGASGFAFSTLGAIAAKTSKLELLTEVVTPLFRYHPAIVAQAAATIDRLSNGRFSLGVGNGESINEKALGFNFPGYKERSERMREALQIIQKLLQGEKIQFKGQYYRAHAKLYSPPLKKVPVFLAAAGEKTAALAGELADGIIISVKEVEDAVKIVETTKEKLEKQFSVVCAKWTVFAQNHEEAWEALGAWRGLRAPSRNSATDPQQLQDEADALSKEEILSRYTIVSNPQGYIDTYSPIIEKLNPEIVVIHTTGKDQKNVIKLLGEKVLPTLKNL